MEIDLEKVSENFPSLDKTYQLSALINVDSFFYALFDHQNLVYSQEVRLEGTAAVGLFEGRDLSINQARIGIYNDKFTLIPEEEYDKDIQKDLLKHATGSILDVHVFADYNDVAKVYICYSMSGDLYNRCRALGENQQIQHVVTALLSDMIKEYTGTVIHFCKIGKQTLLICLIDGVLNVVTNLRGSSPMQLLYYTNLLKEQFSLSEDELLVELSGSFINADGCISLLQKYFRNVNYKEASFVFGNVTMKSSRHYPLKSITECA